MKKIAIGGGQGFWGDSPDAAIHMIRKADIQYLGCDYLAELTLSIMAKQQLKDPMKGYAPDFVTRLLKEAGKEAWEKNIKITTNAGGMNIEGCVNAVKNWAAEQNMKGYKIGYVTGDSIKMAGPSRTLIMMGISMTFWTKSTTVTLTLDMRGSKRHLEMVPMSLSPEGQQTARYSSHRSPTSSAGQKMTGIISQEALWRDIYWSVAVRAPAATTCMTGEMFRGWKTSVSQSQS